MIVILFSPTGSGTVMFTVPFSSVVVVILVPLGNVTITVAFGNVSFVTGSTIVTFIVVLPTVLLVISGIMVALRPTTFTSGIVSWLGV